MRCLQAGIDILLICHRQDRQAEACEAVERAIMSGDLSMKQIEASLTRLSEIKQRFLHPYHPVDLAAIPNTVDAQRIVTCFTRFKPFHIPPSRSPITQHEHLAIHRTKKITLDFCSEDLISYESGIRCSSNMLRYPLASDNASQICVDY